MSLLTIKKKIKAAGFVTGNGNVMKNGKILYSFESITEESLATCCGVAEIGSFDIYVEDDRDYDEDGELPSERSLAYYALLATIADWFVSAKQNMIAAGNTRKKHESRLKKVAAVTKLPVTKGLIFTTNGNETCVIVEAALRLIPTHFKAVSKTINPSSGNVITLWVAKM